MRRRKKTELILGDIYFRFHHPRYIEPDPVQFLRDYASPEDREIAGLICAVLALGRVNSIISILAKVFQCLPSPRKNLTEWDRNEISRRFGWFLYRFYKAQDMTDFLMAIKETIGRWGSLNKCFLAGYSRRDETVLPGLIHLVRELNREGKLKMVPDPEKGSASKRLMLYLRWMVRKDDIDPGGWTGVSPSKLIVPLDTHLLRVGSILNLTDRKDGSLKTAVDITETLKKYDPSDPVRFDFSLTRPGIHPLLDYDEFDV